MINKDGFKLKVVVVYDNHNSCISITEKAAVIYLYSLALCGPARWGRVLLLIYTVVNLTLNVLFFLHRQAVTICGWRLRCLNNAII